MKNAKYVEKALVGLGIATVFGLMLLALNGNSDAVQLEPESIKVHYMTFVGGIFIALSFFHTAFLGIGGASMIIVLFLINLGNSDFGIIMLSILICTATIMTAFFIRLKVYEKKIGKEYLVTLAFLGFGLAGFSLSTQEVADYKSYKTMEWGTRMLSRAEIEGEEIVLSMSSREEGFKLVKHLYYEGLDGERFSPGYGVEEKKKIFSDGSNKTECELRFERHEGELYLFSYHKNKVVKLPQKE